MVAGLGVPIFRVFTVIGKYNSLAHDIVPLAKLHMLNAPLMSVILPYG